MNRKRDCSIEDLRCKAPEVAYIGAEVITYTILWVPYYRYNLNELQNPIQIVKVGIL